MNFLAWLFALDAIWGILMLIFVLVTLPLAYLTDVLRDRRNRKGRR